VKAVNIKGESLVSDVGSGGTIMTTPDTPIGLSKDEANSDATKVTITWQPGPLYYGANIIDYQLTYDQGTGNFIVLAENIQGTQYTFNGITVGVTYKFKV